MESIVRVAALTSRISLGDMHKSAEALIEAAQQLGDRAPDLVLLPKYTLTGGSLGDLAQNGQFAKTAGELHPYLGAKLAALGGLFLFTAPPPAVSGPTSTGRDSCCWTSPPRPNWAVPSPPSR